MNEDRQTENFPLFLVIFLASAIFIILFIIDTYYFQPSTQTLVDTLKIKEKYEKNITTTMITLINNYRSKHGLTKLQPCYQLMKNAERWADYLAAKNILEHSDYIFGDYWSENLLMFNFTVNEFINEIESYGFDRIVNSGLNAWIESKPHCSNILNRNFEYIGIGVGIAQHKENIIIIIVAQFSGFK